MALQRKRTLAGLLALAPILCACAAQPAANATLTATASSSSERPSAGASDTSAASPSVSAMPTVSIACRSSITLRALVLIGGRAAGSVVYEVSDPTHPALICRIGGTSARLVSGPAIEYLKPRSVSETDIVRHSLSDGSEQTLATFPVAAVDGDWLDDGSALAFTVPSADGNAGSPIQVVLDTRSANGVLFTYPLAPTDCICRFGLPGPTAALSPDGQYLVGGWPVGKGASPFVIYRVADRARMLDLSLNDGAVLWEHYGHRLFVIGTDGVRTWSPEDGLVSLKNTKPWSFFPGESPDGNLVVYTAYADPSQQQVRPYLYDLRSSTTGMLVDQPRSQALFVKHGWIWSLEEGPCDPNQCGPWGTAPTGKVYATDLASGGETAVSFAQGDAPLTGTNWVVFREGDLWSG